MILIIFWPFVSISPGRGLLSSTEFLFHFSILLKIRKLPNALTQSLAGWCGDMQLDCVRCSCVFGLDWNIHPPPPFLFYTMSCPAVFHGLIFLVFSSLVFFIPFSSLTAYSSSFLPSISLPISVFPVLSPPTPSLTECCGASAAGSLPICYITVPSASLNHCWARLALARLHISLLYLKYCPTANSLSVWVQIELAF